MSINRTPRLSPAERTGLVALTLAACVAFFDPHLAIIPLALLLLVYAIAPFWPRLAFFGPVISRGSSGQPRVALTFDDGPDPTTTPALLALLARYRVPATFFVIGNRAALHPDLVRAILDGGHEVANHSYHHQRYRMFWRPHVLAEEITATQKALAAMGIRPLVFRPPMGITTPVMGPVLAEHGLTLVNFSCRALDGGNRRIKHLAGTILARVRADDIILLHDATHCPQRDITPWLTEIETILQGLSDKGLAAVPLADLIDRPVMRSISFS